MRKAKVVIIPARPNPQGHTREHPEDARYVEGQRLLMQAIHYLVHSDREANRPAAELLLEHVRTQFRMSDTPETSGSDGVRDGC